MALRLYHGTSVYSGEALMAGEAPICQLYRHLPGNRRAFCTSRSQEEAARFAMRKVTRIGDSGVIVVFDGDKLKPGRDCRNAKDSGFFDEQEVAVFAVRKLKAIDLLGYKNGRWVSIKDPVRVEKLA